MAGSTETLGWWLSPWVLGLLGLCVGSFLNVVAHRLPRMMERQWWADVAAQLSDADSWQRTFGDTAPKPLAPTSQELERRLEALAPLSLARPASRCPSCGHAIRWHENIPLLGWLRLRGRCAACGTRISARYPLVELVTGLLFAGLAWRIGPQPAVLLWCGVAATLVALTAIDWDTTLLPDSLTLPLLWAGLCAAALGWTLPVTQSIAGAVVGYLSLWSVYWLFKLTTGKEGMGAGDFKLLAALGAWLGWQAILPIVLMASVIGAVVGIGMKLGNALREGRYVPFGPFLAGGGLVVMLAGLDRVLGWIGQ
ncbi:prepilin peptidase [Ideonella dechloratans]|uniref:Prepilin leader peptidase/N-methyltransferase n=1 Tax=Ideonella dechloratans TaxID=36863 RepID=A0A643FAQ8_IDEDE|nr:A24 family peptidase [Ideonella dechloratans]KAB0580604.1 prepilin peptidase [Ideonella dechloratans]UFU09447.1 A24 family peptidase [Ideonella dechloratans]